VAPAICRVRDAGTSLLRYGGDAFAVLLEVVARESAAELAERIRTTIDHGDLDGMASTVSVGSATWQRGAGTLVAALVRAACASPSAERAGRKRVASEDAR
jgi:PleD family two-component response regulator